MAKRKTVAVIGAGPMGLAVAYQAAMDGHAVTVIEADDRIGGMSASFDFDGLSIERYYHFICASDQSLFDLLQELGIQDRLRWKETRMGYYYQSGVHPWGNPIALLQFPGLSLISKIRYGAHAGGSDTLLNALRSAIEGSGGEIRLRSPVERIVHRDGEVVGVTVGGQVQEFDAVVSTVPVPLIPRLIPDLPTPLLRQYQALKNIAVVCVIAKTSKPITDNFWLNVNDQDMDIPGLVEFSNLRDLDQHVTYVPFYMPAEHPKFQEPNEIFVGKVRQYLQTINPDLTEDDIISVYANRLRYAQPICGPGYLDTLPPIALPIEGLFVADTSYYYPEDRGISESVKMGRDIARMI